MRLRFNQFLDIASEYFATKRTIACDGYSPVLANAVIQFFPVQVGCRYRPIASPGIIVAFGWHLLAWRCSRYCFQDLKSHEDGFVVY